MSATRGQRKANDDLTAFFESNLHLPSRTIFCGNYITDDLEADDQTAAELFIKGMHLLNATDGDITVILNHWGGDEYHNLAIYDAIATSPHRVIAKVFGAAFSMGSWILQAADHRIMAPHATLLLHYGSWDLTTEDASEERVASAHNEGQRLRRQMEQTYLGRMREKDPTFPLDRLCALLRAESYLPATEAIALGLADEVLQ